MRRYFLLYSPKGRAERLDIVGSIEWLSMASVCHEKERVI